VCLDGGGGRKSSFTARAHIGTIANVGVDVAAYAVDVEGAGAVGTAEELFADLEM
jgi:hypothetical protein